MSGGKRNPMLLKWKTESAGKPLLLARSFECVAPSAESQRDSATKPRVARNELPWENARRIGDNPERVAADDNGNKTMPQPLWGCESSVTFPRVARSSQPWALLRNPFGIEDTGKEPRLAGAFAPPRPVLFTHFFLTASRSPHI